MRFFKCRKEAKRLAEVTQLFLECCPSKWVVSKTDPGHVRFKDSAMSIKITPRRFRIFDKIQVMYKSVDVWIPLRWRLKLRREARRVLAEKTRITMEESMSKTRKLGT